MFVSFEGRKTKCILRHLSFIVMQTKSVAVFCGSKSGKNPAYEKHAGELGSLIAACGIQLIYGGGNMGIMSAVANAVLSKGGKVTGVIPKVLIEWEHKHEGLTELVISENMHTRKKMMYELSDAAVILPGGYGTLDELFEMLTWNQLNIHNKKIYLLNSEGYYNHLVFHLRQMEREGFLYDPFDQRVRICTTPSEVINQLP